jgi:hypothetical protein
VAITQKNLLDDHISTELVITTHIVLSGKKPTGVDQAMENILVQSPDSHPE